MKLKEITESLENKYHINEHVISERDWDELTDGITDDYEEGKITEKEYEKKYELLNRMLIESKEVDEMSFDELLNLWWEMNGQEGAIDMGMEPDEVDSYFKENPDELLYNVKEGLKYFK